MTTRLPTTGRLLRAAAAVVVMLLAAGCTGGEADPLPTGGSPARPTQASTTPARAGPTTDEVVALIDEYRNVSLALPEMPPAQAADTIAEQVRPLTTDDGTARQRATRQAANLRQADPDQPIPVLRGTPSTALLDDPSLSGKQWTTTGCVAVDGQLTDVATGEPTSDIEGGPTRYTEVDIALVAEGQGGWLLADYSEPAPQDRTPCVPRELQLSIDRNWRQYVDATVAWVEAGTPPDELGELERLVTGKALTDLQSATPGRTRDYSTEVYRDHKILIATPTRVESQWCFDLSAMSDQDATDQPAAFVDGTWVSENGRWLLARTTTTFTDSPDAPEDHRCFHV